jgi:hypothetical protein
MKDTLHQVDVCFVIDTTSSMNPFIQAAKKQLLSALERLSKLGGIDLYTAVVEYRDHPPQENSFITQIYQLTGNIGETQKAVNKLQAVGGGDGPEAVYQGLHDACQKVEWRTHSCRYIILIGDAPPHAFPFWLEGINLAVPSRRNMGGDHWPSACPSGLDPHKVAAAAEEKNITIHAVLMGNYAAAREAFSLISLSTGGTFAQTGAADEAVQNILSVVRSELENLALDRKILDLTKKESSLDSELLAAQASCSRIQAASSLARLGRRGFLVH